MITWFLGLFHTFNALMRETESLRTAVNELTTEKLLLQDRLEAALEDKQHLWIGMESALQNEREALRTQVNHAVQRAGGGIPYPNAHSLPANVVREPQTPGPVGRRGRMLPSEIAQQQTQKFMEEFVESLAPKA